MCRSSLFFSCDPHCGQRLRVGKRRLPFQCHSRWREGSGDEQNLAKVKKRLLLLVLHIIKNFKIK